MEIFQTVAAANQCTRIAVVAFPCVPLSKFAFAPPKYQRYGAPSLCTGSREICPAIGQRVRSTRSAGPTRARVERIPVAVLP